MIATTPYYPAEFRDNLAKTLCAAPFATDVIDAPTQRDILPPSAPGVKASELIFPTGTTAMPRPRKDARTICKAWKASPSIAPSERSVQNVQLGHAQLVAGAHRDFARTI